MIDHPRSGIRIRLLLVWWVVVIFVALRTVNNFTTFHRNSNSLLRFTVLSGGDTITNAPTVLSRNKWNNDTVTGTDRFERINSNTISYPLSGMNLTSAEQSYIRGFWQRSNPVPWDRWTTISNTTCVTTTENITKRNDDESVAEHKSLQDRVPFAMILGTQKGGTTALAHYLYNHPNIQHSPIKEFRFFDETMDHERSLVSLPYGGIPSDRALRHYWESVIGNAISLHALEIPTQLKVLDATPEYLFRSDRVSHRILCITPWVKKFVVLLRNPIDRAFSQYHMQLQRDLHNPQNRRGFVTFEEYIELDIEVLYDVGVLRRRDERSVHDDTDVVDFDRQSEGWKTYTKLGLNSPVGRGLYSIQLRQWFDALRSYGRDPKNEFLILKSETMRDDSKSVYSHVLEFLDLSPHTAIAHQNEYKPIHTTSYRNVEMNPNTRAKLENLFKPFNRQLEELLGDEWHGVWE